MTLGDDPGLDDVLVVVVYTGYVHRWDCGRARIGYTTAWRPDMAGLDDRPCPDCLPGGLPA